VRAAGLLLVLSPFGIAALAPGSVSRATRACAVRSACVVGRLPAPITITAGRATYRIGRDGRVLRTAAPPSPYPRAASWFPATDTWYMLRRHHLVVGRGHRALWRSRMQIASPWRLGVVAAGPHAVAFQAHHQLYLAPLGGVERPVARREFPLGWTRDGLYTYRYQGRELLLRSVTGRLVKVIARRPLGSDDYVVNGNLYFIARGAVMRAQGTRTELIAPLKRLGLSADVWMQSLGRYIQLQDDHRLVVLRAKGSELASTPLPPGGARGEGLIGSIAVAPHADAVAFTTASDSSAGRSAGVETVYLLAAGTHTAIPVHREAGSFGGCERWVNLQWHGRWLLYNATEGNIAVIDGSGGHHAIELTNLGRHLPGGRDGARASWTGQPTL
jgi:hypothetical protein